MIYHNSVNWWANTQQRDKRIGFIAALSTHVIIFFIGGSIFFKTAQFSVQPVETTEVSLVDTIEQPPAEIIETPQPMQRKQEKFVKAPEKINQSVKVEASPNYFQNPSPPYPELAKKMRQEGLVLLAVDVDREGLPTKVEIEKSSGYRMLDQSALSAVSRWKFQPGRIGDLPVESKVTVPVRFKLQTD